MDYEKKYKEALERARKLHENSNGMILKKWLWNIFPELKESEDEGIRKSLINYFEDFSLDTFAGLNPKSIIAWLKKQGEPVETKAKIFLINKGYPVDTNGIFPTYEEMYNIIREGLEEQDKSIKIKRGKNYLCTKTHKYAGARWIKDAKYYASDNYTLVNQKCEYYCPEYSKEEHNNLFEEVKYDGCLEKQGEQSSLNINRECLKGIKRVQEYQDLSDWEKEFDKIASMYAHNKNQEGYNDSWYVKERAAEMLYYAKKELEKQGEQKHTDKVEPKFKIGDWVIDKQNVVHQIANVIENVTNHTYGYDIVGGGYFNDNTEGVRLWTINDAKDGDVLTWDGTTCVVLFKNIKNNKCFISYCFANDISFEIGTSHYIEGCHPATKEQHDLLFTKMKEAGYEWDAVLKKLFVIV